MKSASCMTLAAPSPISWAIEWYWAVRSTNGTFGCVDVSEVCVEIFTLAFNLDLESFTFNGTIHGFKNAHNVAAFTSTADGAGPGAHTVKKMAALALQWLDGLDARANNVAIADLEAKFAVVQWLLLDG